MNSESSQDYQSKAIDALVVSDHRHINKIYDHFKAIKEDYNYAEANKWRNLLIYEITRHAAAEEMVLYPSLVNILGKDVVNKNRREHFQVKEMLSEIDAMSIEDMSLDPKFENLMNAFNAHAKEEEEVELEKLKGALEEKRREELGKAFEDNKMLSPTHPHPSSPDKGGILQNMTGMLVLPLDKLHDMMRRFPSEDQIHEILHR